MLTPLHTNLTASDLLKGDIKLASPLVLYLELNKVIDNPIKSMSDAGRVIDKDPGLSARLLKIVNSAFFGFPYQISTITRAITLIGIRELQYLVLTTLIIDKFSSLPGGMMTMKEFWSTSLRCALIAKELSIHNNDSEKSETIFICGLLHEIGLLVLYHRIPELARKSGLLAQSSSINEIEAENQIIGFNRYQVGAELTRLWKLPEIISATISHHQSSLNPTPDKFIQESAIIALSSQISKMETIYKNTDYAPDWNLVKLPPATIDAVVAQANEQFDESYQTFFAA